MKKYGTLVITGERRDWWVEVTVGGKWIHDVHYTSLRNAVTAARMMAYSAKDTYWTIERHIAINNDV